MRRRFWSESTGWTLVRTAILVFVVFVVLQWVVADWLALVAGVVAAALTFADQVWHRGR